MLCSNVEGALGNLDRKFKLVGPRHDERGHRPLEVWKMDLHTSEYMRNVVCVTMVADHGSDAMAFWLLVLHDHMRTQLHTLLY